MTDRVGRHAAAQDAAETLVIPAQRWPDENGNGESGPDGPDQARRRTARGRPARGPGHG